MAHRATKIYRQVLYRQSLLAPALEEVIHISQERLFMLQNELSQKFQRLNTTKVDFSLRWFIVGQQEVLLHFTSPAPRLKEKPLSQAGKWTSFQKRHGFHRLELLLWSHLTGKGLRMWGSTWLFGEQWISGHSSIASIWQKKAKVGVPELKNNAAKIPTLVFLAQKPVLFSKLLPIISLFSINSISLFHWKLGPILPSHQGQVEIQETVLNNDISAVCWSSGHWDLKFNGRLEKTQNVAFRGFNSSGLKERGETGCSQGYPKDLVPQGEGTLTRYAV